MIRTNDITKDDISSIVKLMSFELKASRTNNAALVGKIPGLTPKYQTRLKILQNLKSLH